MSRHFTVAAIIRYQAAAGESDTVYRVSGWTDTSANSHTHLDHPARLSRLGPDGWHTLETFDSSDGSGVYGLKTQEELIRTAKQRIEGFYEPGAMECETRTFPFPVKLTER